ncbi:hypothetical protein TOPH_06734, partial [Tolypocladium ophioglossoides CBS 100239]
KHLYPFNNRAKSVLAHPSNEHLLAWLNRRLVLSIGHIRPISGDSTTLATLGRNGDVIVEGYTIAKIQCSFEIDLDTKVVMFCDRSHNQTSQVLVRRGAPRRRHYRCPAAIPPARSRLKEGHGSMQSRLFAPYENPMPPDEAS